MARPKLKPGEKGKYTQTAKQQKALAMFVSNNNQKELDENGGFFRAAYRLYFCNDIPPRQSFEVFCKTMRTDDQLKCAKYLLEYGTNDYERLKELIAKDTFEHREALEDKFTYLKILLKEETK